MRQALYHHECQHEPEPKVCMELYNLEGGDKLLLNIDL